MANLAQQLTFILGGARSGKSRYAEAEATEAGGRVLYVATAEALDDEMQERIIKHQSDRPAEWDTLEAPTQAAEVLSTASQQYDTILLDCLTLLASNILLEMPEEATQTAIDAAILSEVNALLGVIKASKASWVVVSNEVGMGVVPATKLGRSYRDALGRANQLFARAADRTVLMVAGLPFDLPPKGTGKLPFG